MFLNFVRHDRAPLQPLIGLDEVMERIGAHSVHVAWEDGHLVSSGGNVEIPEDPAEAIEYVDRMRARWQAVESALRQDLKRGDLSSYLDDLEHGLVRIPATCWNLVAWDDLMVGKSQSLGSLVAGSALESRPILFSKAEVDDWNAALPADTALYDRTGDPGRPEKGRTLYLMELERRLEQDEVLPLIEEARHLHAWYRLNHPNRARPELKTIRNNILRHPGWRAKFMSVTK